MFLLGLLRRDDKKYHLLSGRKVHGPPSENTLHCGPLFFF